MTQKSLDKVTPGEFPKELSIKSDKLLAWQCTPAAPLIRVAHQDRKWMDESNKRFVYRCLPMVIANSFGWDIINPRTFTAIWSGGRNPSDVKITFPTNDVSNVPQAHFGEGVLTFTLGHLFQTPPGINLYVKGPSNEIKDGIMPLEGIVETDFSPATFTMNWRFTRPNHPVVFEAGESYCRIFPIPRYITEVFQPEMRMLEDNPDLHRVHFEWRKSRDTFNKGLSDPTSEYSGRGWQKEYFLGGGRDWPKFPAHQTKLHQPNFEDLRPDIAKAQDLVPRSSVQSFTLTGFDGKPLKVFAQNRGQDVKSSGNSHYSSLHDGSTAKGGACPAGANSATGDPGSSGDGSSHS